MRAATLKDLGLVMLPLLLLAQPARAEVISTGENGFVARLTAEVTAPPAEAWKTLTNPALWWQRQHTFSGDSANLTFDPVVGGCFCETLPRPEGAPATQKAGGVQHMRVVYIEPPRAVRLVGALGPLQSEALVGTMTMTVKPTDKGARILFEYVVGGFMRYKVEEIAPAVDRMLTVQMESLAAKLGAVKPAAAPRPGPAAGPPAEDLELPPAPAPQASGGNAAVPLGGAADYRLPSPGKAVPAAGASAATRPPPIRSAAAKAAAAKPAAKAAPAIPAAKLAQPAPAKPAVKAPATPMGKPGAKPPAKPGGKAPSPDDAERRDANAAFDALLGGVPAP